MSAFDFESYCQQYFAGCGYEEYERPNTHAHYGRLWRLLAQVQRDVLLEASEFVNNYLGVNSWQTYRDRGELVNAIRKLAEEAKG